jgi:hypothetical protein
MRLLLGGKLAPQTRRGQPQRNHFLLYAVARLRLPADNDRRVGCASRHCRRTLHPAVVPASTPPKNPDNSIARPRGAFLAWSAPVAGTPVARVVSPRLLSLVLLMG